MDTTYSVKVSIKEKPSVFNTSETITFPSQTKWNDAAANYGITAGIPNGPYTENPFCVYSTVSNEDITPMLCRSYWCKCGETPNMDPDKADLLGYGLGNCFTGIYD